MEEFGANRAEPTNPENHYILLVKEHLPAGWSDQFEGLSVTCTSAGETQISGFIPDQAALHGLLARIRDLNLTLLAVNRIAKQDPLFE